MKTFLLTGKVSAAKRAALGDVCIHFSILEFKIEQTIWALRDQPRKIGRLHTRARGSGAGALRRCSLHDVPTA